MKEKNICKIVQDLLPNYIEKFQNTVMEKLQIFTLIQMEIM